MDWIHLLQALFVLALSGLAAGAGGADRGGRASQEQVFAKPLRVIVATAPGAGLDFVTRVVTSRLSEQTGAVVVVENIAGANGILAVGRVVASPPDGYTLLSNGGSMPINAVFGKFDFDVRQELRPVVTMSLIPYILYVPSSSPINSVKELAAHAKAHPGKLNHGSAGVGSVAHLGMEWLASLAGIEITHVAYKANTAVNNDLIAGRLDVVLGSVSGRPLVRAGKVKVIGVTTLQRNPDFPDAPTVAESGWKDYDLANTYSLFVSTRTPGGVLADLNRQFSQVVGLPEIRDKLASEGSLPVANRTPDALRAAFVSEIDRWGSLIAKTGIRLQE